MKQNWILVGAVTAMLAASTGLRAQDTTTTTTDSTSATATSGAMSGGMSNSMSGGMMNNGMIDYSVLSDKTLDYTELMKAKARGLSDNEVATVAKIAEKTGYSFSAIVEKVLNGETFAKLADEMNLKLQDVMDVNDEKMKIAAYEAAYQNTGKKSMGMMNSDMSMSGGMSNGSMSGGMSGGSMSTSSASAGASGGMMMSKDIVDAAMGDKRFTTLVRELKKAGLVETLKGAGPFTVFAPTNDAFKKLPKAALKNLENNPDQLKQVLTYHVIPAKVDAATAMAMTSPTSPPTVEGGTLQVTTSNGTVMVNDAKVVQADIMASNGIIHAIDTVLMPSDMSTGTTGAGSMTTPATGTMTPAAPAGGTMPATTGQ